MRAHCLLYSTLRLPWLLETAPLVPFKVPEAQKGTSRGHSKEATFFSQLFCSHISAFNIIEPPGCHVKSRMGTEIVSEAVAFLVVLLVHNSFFVRLNLQEAHSHPPCMFCSP